jgi:hypothetical protein
MIEVKIQLSGDELVAIHNLANKVGCTPDEAIEIMTAQYLEEANKPSSVLANAYSQISVFFDELSKKAESATDEDHLCIPCFLRKTVDKND